MNHKNVTPNIIHSFIDKRDKGMPEEYNLCREDTETAIWRLTNLYQLSISSADGIFWWFIKNLELRGNLASKKEEKDGHFVESSYYRSFLILSNDEIIDFRISRHPTRKKTSASAFKSFGKPVYEYCLIISQLPPSSPKPDDTIESDISFRGVQFKYRKFTTEDFEDDNKRGDMIEELIELLKGPPSVTKPTFESLQKFEKNKMKNKNHINEDSGIGLFTMKTDIPNWHNRKFIKCIDYYFGGDAIHRISEADFKGRLRYQFYHNLWTIIDGYQTVYGFINEPSIDRYEYSPKMIESLIDKIYELNKEHPYSVDTKKEFLKYLQENDIVLRDNESYQNGKTCHQWNGEHGLPEYNPKGRIQQSPEYYISRLEDGAVIPSYCDYVDGKKIIHPSETKEEAMEKIKNGTYNNEIKESKYMNTKDYKYGHKVVRHINESELRDRIAESVKKVLNEMKFDGAEGEPSFDMQDINPDYSFLNNGYNDFADDDYERKRKCFTASQLATQLSCLCSSFSDYLEFNSESSPKESRIIDNALTYLAKARDIANKVR